MPYEIAAEKIRVLPEKAVEEVMHYIDYITMIYVNKPKAEKDTSFIDNMQGILSHEDVEEIRRTSHLKFKEA